MKNKILATLAIIGLTATLTTGCGAINNDYISIKQYKGLEVVEVPSVEITDERIDEEIELLQQAHSTLIEVTDRSAKLGDTVVLDFKGLKDGEPFDGSDATEYTMMLGSSNLTPSFDEAIVGHEVGEFEIEVQFPINYHYEELAGETAVFEINLRNIETHDAPALDDDFAQSVSPTAKTMDELRAEIKNTHTENAQSNISQKQDEAIWDALAEQTTVKKYPQDRIDEIKKQLLRHYEETAIAYDIRLEVFIQDYMHTTKEELDVTLQEEAEKRVLKELSASLIAEKEKLIPSEEFLDEQLDELAGEYGFANGKDFAREHSEEFVKTIVSQRLVSAFLLDHAKLVPETQSTATPTVAP